MAACTRCRELSSLGAVCLACGSWMSLHLSTCISSGLALLTCLVAACTMLCVMPFTCACKVVPARFAAGCGMRSWLLLRLPSALDGRGAGPGSLLSSCGGVIGGLACMPLCAYLQPSEVC